MEASFCLMVAAVFFGNMLTAAFLWGLSRANRIPESELTGRIYAALIAPPLVLVITLIGAGAKLPILGAVLPL